MTLSSYRLYEQIKEQISLPENIQKMAIILEVNKPVVIEVTTLVKEPFTIDFNRYELKLKEESNENH